MFGYFFLFVQHRDGQIQAVFLQHIHAFSHLIQQYNNNIFNFFFVKNEQQ